MNTFLGVPASGLENLKNFTKEGLHELFIAVNDDYELNGVKAAAKGCAGHEGQCGTCVNDVWYPCA